MSKKPKPIDFEATMLELASLIDKMEQDDLSLEESLKDFERGISLTRICQSSLKDAEQRIKILTQGIEEEFLTDK
ncbi:MAG: exodeoxyribonuclease VII small subunit [Cocleimonas sp.]|nr:exodeoxyribonuclease VII small subunit [Cocleimonas sp.]